MAERHYFGCVSHQNGTSTKGRDVLRTADKKLNWRPIFFSFGPQKTKNMADVRYQIIPPIFLVSFLLAVFSDTWTASLSEESLKPPAKIILHIYCTIHVEKYMVELFVIFYFEEIPK